MQRVAVLAFVCFAALSRTQEVDSGLLTGFKPGDLNDPRAAVDAPDCLEPELTVDLSWCVTYKVQSCARALPIQKQICQETAEKECVKGKLNNFFDEIYDSTSTLAMMTQKSGRDQWLLGNVIGSDPPKVYIRDIGGVGHMWQKWIQDTTTGDWSLKNKGTYIPSFE